MNVLIEKNQRSCFIALPITTAEQWIAQGHKRVICTVNQSFQFHCAILKSKNIGYYIMIGKKTLKNGNLVAGQEIHIELTPDTTKYQAEIPEELKEVLDSDVEAFERFHQLTPGKQRSIIYLVTGVKSTEKRIDRALKIMENIKMGITNNRDLLK